MATRLNQLISKSFERIAGPDRTIWRTEARTRVVMIHAGRCGSTVLCDLLNQHKNIYWDGEIFNGPGLKPYPGARAYPWQKWRRSKFFPERPFAFIANRSTVSNESVFGFEMKYLDMRINNIEVATFAERLAELEFDHVINLHRRNKLKWLVSHLVARQRSKFQHHLHERSELSPITINMNNPYANGQSDRDDFSVFDLLARLERETDCFEGALKAKRVLNLVYEDHIEKDPVKAYRMVCDFLGVEERPSQVRYSRSTPFPLRQIVANFDELAQYVRGTKYEWMLHDE